MIQSSALYSITYHVAEKMARLTWLPGTATMTDEHFKETLEVFAESVLQHGARRLVIDVRQFEHRPSAEVLAWRDEVTVPKYNRAGAKRLAWIWPGDVSSMKSTSEGRSFEDRYFATESEALAWVMQ